MGPTPTRLSRGVSVHWGGGHLYVQRFGLLTYHVNVLTVPMGRREGT